MHSLSGVLAPTAARDPLCKDSLIAISTPQVSHFYTARAYPIIQSTSLIPLILTGYEPRRRAIQYESVTQQLKTLFASHRIAEAQTLFVAYLAQTLPVA